MRGRASLLFRASGGETFQRPAAPIQRFTLGGPFALGALHVNARRGDHFAYGSAGLLYQLGETGLGLFKKTFAASWYEVGDAYDKGPSWAHNGSVGLLSETSFGLFFVGGSLGAGQSRLYFSVGQLF